MYGLMIYLFTLNEHAHIRDNPKVQYHLSMLKEEEDDFITDRREAYSSMVKNDKAKRRKRLRLELEKKLQKLKPEEQDSLVEKHDKKRRLIMLEEEIKF